MTTITPAKTQSLMWGEPTPTTLKSINAIVAAGKSVLAAKSSSANGLPAADSTGAKGGPTATSLADERVKLSLRRILVFSHRRNFI